MKHIRPISLISAHKKEHYNMSEIHSYEPEYTARNTNETFRTELCRETPDMIQILKHDRCKVHQVCVQLSMLSSLAQEWNSRSRLQM
jgi:hypothetical protein